MPESRFRQVRVTYRRQVSDGNYGTESAEVGLEWWVPDEHDDATDVAEARDLLAQARDLALAQLRQSLAPSVRSAATPRTTAPTRAAATAPVDDEVPF